VGGNCWRVETTEPDGKRFVATFEGSRAEQRAREYAALLTAPKKRKRSGNGQNENT